MNMVFCRGCGKEIHITAQACPQCGAPQANRQAVSSDNTGGAINQWYLGVLKKYAVFSGRARRKEYWMFTLFNILIAFLLGILERIIGAEDILSNLYSLAVLIPGIAVGVRRLHDTDRSGWWLLLPIVNIVFLALEGQSGNNRFGPDPKETV